MQNNDFKDIQDVHWKTHESTDQSALFYKLGDSDQELDLFRERIKSAHYKILILNKIIDPMPPRSLYRPLHSWPKIQEALMDRLYPIPAGLKIIAVTGTNGKTTTADFVLQIGHFYQKKGFSIGTLGVREFRKNLLQFGLTTPSFIDLRKFLHLYGHDKDFCVLETSSHALSQKRFGEIKFDQAGWTSFSQDHLDYHKTMEDYFESKCKIIHFLRQDSYLWVPSSQKKLFSKIREKTEKVKLSREISGPFPLIFQNNFNLDNLELAVSLSENTLNICVSKDIFEKMISPEGRFFLRQKGSSFIVVDFAHTPDALENMAQGLKSSFPQKTLKVLFGCGGDRDKLKRSLMGKVAMNYFDVIYVTSDNPRSEDPDEIIKDIVQGFTLDKTSDIESDKKIYQIVDRPLAVQQALAELAENEVLLLAGKGHEQFIDIKGVKIPHSDTEEVEKFLTHQSSERVTSAISRRGEK